MTPRLKTGNDAVVKHQIGVSSDSNVNFALKLKSNIVVMFKSYP